MEQTKLNIEKRALEIVNQSIQKLKSQFDNLEIQFNPIVVTSNNGGDEPYFSEIEIELWKSNNLIDALSVIIFMDGKAVLKIDELELWLEEEFKEIINKSRIL